MNRSLIRQALLALTVVACMGLASTPAFAEYSPSDGPADSPSAAAMTLDMFLLRPLGLASTIAGVGVFVISLPFTLLGAMSRRLRMCWWLNPAHILLQGHWANLTSRINSSPSCLVQQGKLLSAGHAVWLAQGLVPFGLRAVD